MQIKYARYPAGHIFLFLKHTIILKSMRFFKRRTTAKGLISTEDQTRVSNAIAKAEITTSGEIRVYFEQTCPLENPLERAAEIFAKLEMEKTELRNGVLIYIALKDHKAAIFADEGIYQKTGGPDYWQEEFEIFKTYLAHDELVEGLIRIISDIGHSLSKYFPYRPGIDKNELPDEIVFGHH